MGIRGAKPSIEKALSSRETFVPTGIADGLSRPADLSPDAEGVWDVLLTDLVAMGVFREADSIILTELCEMIVEAKKLRFRMHNPPERWYRLETGLSKDERDEFDLQYEHIQDQLAEMWMLSNTYKRLRVAYLQTMRSLKSLVDEFGITPVARLRLGLLQLQGQSLADAFRDDDDDVEPRKVDSLALPVGEDDDAG